MKKAFIIININSIKLIAVAVFAFIIPSIVFSAQSTFTSTLTTTGLTTNPPSVPTSLTANAVAYNQIDLNWTASTPNYYSIAGYRIFRDSVFLATTTGTSYSDTGLTASTQYSYNVEAFDTLIQLSGLSNTAYATTSAAPTPTPTPSPTSPAGGGGSGGSGGGGSQIVITDLIIIPGTDKAMVNFKTNVPTQTKLDWGLVSDYELGSLVNSAYTKEHSFTISGLNPATNYKVRISASIASGASTNTHSQFTTLTQIDNFGPLPNPNDFKAEAREKDILLSWVNPNDPRFNDVRIVRTEGFYPIDQFDGDPIYEGDEQSFVDTSAKPGVTYYYAIFSRDREGNYSSGALAQARIALPGELATTTVADPFANIPEASNVDPRFKSLRLADFEFLQDGKLLASVENNTVAIHGDKNLTIRLKSDKVPPILKTIAFTLKDPDDKNKVFPFLLRINKDKTYYEATIGALGKSGRYGMSVAILDYENNGLVRLNGTLAALSFMPFLDLSNSFDFFGLLILFLIILLVILAVLAIKRWMDRNNNRENYQKNNSFWKFGSKKVIASIIIAIAFVGSNIAHAAFNNQINYQGKLTNSLNAIVPDGNYSIRFKLYTTQNGGSPIWTETLCNTSNCAGSGAGSDNRVSVSNGLFSVMLGSTTPFTGVDFNQTLYLGVEIGGSGATASWDGEMSPRKILGAVPAAFIAENANALSGLNSTQFLRSDAQNATSSSSTFLNIVQSGAGKVAEFFGTASQSVLALLSNGNVGIGTTTPYAKLSVAGEAVAEKITATSTTATSTLPNLSVTNLMLGSDYIKDITGNGLSVSNGSLNVTGLTFSGNANMVASYDASGNLVATSTPQFSSIIATSTTETSTFAGALSVGGSNGLNALSNGFVGIGTNNPGAKLDVQGDAYIQTSLGIGAAVQQGQLRVAGANQGLIYLSQMNANPDEKNWYFDAEGGDLYWGVNNDAFGSGSNYARVARTGSAVDSFEVMYAANNQAWFAQDVAGIQPYNVSPTAHWHIRAGSSAANNAPLKIDSGALLSTPEVGALEFLTDKWYGTITTGSLRKEFTLNDQALTSGRMPYITTNGRLTDSANFVFNGTNLGIGTTTPGQALSVGGDILGNKIIGSYFVATSTIASVLPYASTTAITVSGTNGLQLAAGLNGPLQAVNGLVSSTSTLSVVYGGTGTSTIPTYGKILVGNSSNGYDLVSTSSLNIQANLANITGTLGVANGGTGATSFGQGWIYTDGGTDALNSSTSPTVNYITATSTTATSTFNGGLVAGTNGLYVLQNGKVGIATSGPQYALTIAGTNTFVENSAGSPGYIFSRIGGKAGALVAATSGSIFTYDSSGFFGILSSTNVGVRTAPGGSGSYRLYVSSDSSGGGVTIGYGSTSAKPDGLSVFGSTGIGTSSPYAKLSVTGTASASTTLAVYGFNSQTAPLFLVASTTGSATSTAFVIDGNGKVGVGTSSPYQQLAVQGAIVGQTVNADDQNSTSTFAGGLSVSALKVASDYFTDLTGSGLSNTDGVLTLNTTGNWTGTFDGQEGAYYLNAINLTNFGTPFYNFFSATTTDALAQGSTNKYYSDAFVNSYINASTTIPKTYSNNTFTGSNIFNGTLTVGTLNGPLQANNGVVSATTSVGVLYGGTGATSFGQGWIYTDGGTGALNSSTSPTVNYITATSTTATSSFAWGLTMASSTVNVVGSSGRVGIGTASPLGGLDVSNGTVALYLGADGNSFNRTNNTQKIARVISSQYSNSAAGATVFIANNTSSSNDLFIGGGSTSYNAVTGISFYTGANTGTTQGSIRMSINSSGNVGIGTTSPYSKLSVWGSGTGSSRLFELTNNSSTTLLSVLENGTAYFLGNLGIGTTTPGQALSVGGDILGNNIIGSYFTATSTTVASTFPYASTTALTVLGTNGLKVGTLNGPLQANNGVVSATTSIGVIYGGTGLSSAPTYGQILVGNASSGYDLLSTSSLNIQANLANIIGTLGVANGGTGATSFGQGWIYTDGGTGALNSSTSPTVNYITATSTTATSTFNGGLVAGGSGSFRVLQNGNVGIGTASPSRTLYVNGDIESNNYIIAAYNFSNGYYYNSLSNAGYIFVDQTSPRINAPGGYVAFTNGATENMRVSATGNVGIGTTSPFALFAIAASSTNVANTPLFTISTSTASATSTSLMVDSSGRLGIGTSSPTLPLTVSGRSYFSSNVGIGTNSPASDLSVNGGLSLGSYSTSVNAGTGNLVMSGVLGVGLSDTLSNKFAVSGTSYFTGNVGIGTSSPYSLLSVAGQVVGQYFTATSTTASSTLPNLVTTNLRLSGSLYDSTNSAGVNGYVLQTNGSTAQWVSTSSLNIAGGSGVTGGTAGMLTAWTGASTLTATGTPTAASYFATSTTATSTFLGGLSVVGSTGLNVLQNGNVGIGTSSPISKLTVEGPGLESALVLLDSNYTGSDTIGASIFLQSDNGVFSMGNTNKTLTSTTSLMKINSDSNVRNVAIGLDSMKNNITSGSDNVAIGYNVLSSNTSGLRNTGIGYGTLGQNTVGQGNIGIGGWSVVIGTLGSNTTGSNNLALGVASLAANTVGYDNISLGRLSLASNQVSSYNIAIGSNALNSNTATGSIAIGYQAGDALTTGSYNVILGYDVDAPSDTDDNQLNIGNLIFGTSLDGRNKTISSGNIGIGTTSPYAKLSVAGQVVGQYFTATSTTASSTLPNLIATNLRLNGILYDTNNASGTNGYVLQTTGSGVQWVATSSLNIVAGITGGTAGMLSAWTGASTLTATDTPTAGSYFATSTTATSTFLGGLSVGGTSGLYSFTNGRTSLASTSPWAQLSINPNGITGPSFAIGSSTATNFVVTNAGNVGVGTTTPDSLFSLYAPGTNATRESVFRGRVTDGGNSLVEITNSTVTNNLFIPTIAGYFDSNSTSPSLEVRGLVSSANDASDSANSGIIAFTAMRTNSAANPNNGTFSNPQNRKLFSFNNQDTVLMTIAASGNLGIATSAPYAKLSVAGQAVAQYYTATSTTVASTFPYASTTALTVAGTNGLTLGSLTGPLQAINGAVSATSTLSIFYGGTGLSTTPTYGQLMMGNGSGAYTLVSTSSLGILASSAIGAGTIGQLPYYASNGQAITATSSLFLSTAGYLGIGTTTPTSALSVFSSAVPQLQLAYDKSNYLAGSVSSSGGVTLASNGTLGGFTITNPQPTAVNSGTGTAAPYGLNVSGGVGGNSLDTNIGVGGVGGGIQMNAGAGGTATASTFSETGGAGGVVSISSGAGGAASSASVDFMTRQAGAGGQLSLTAGSGGDASNGGTASTNTAGNGGKLVLKAGTGGNASGATSNTGGNGGSLYISGGAGGTGSTQNGTAGNIFLGYDSLSSIGNVYFGNQVASFIGSTGNFGVGTSSPYAKLSVAGEVVGQYFTATSTTATSTFAGGLSVGGASGLYAFTNGRTSLASTSPWAQLSINPDGIFGPAFAIGSSTATNFVVTNAGKVGVGTNNPSTMLSVQQVGSSAGVDIDPGFYDTQINLTRVGTNRYSTISYYTGSNSQYWYSGLADSDDIGGGDEYYIGTARNNPLLWIERTGNVGIGTSSPYAKLSVAGEVVGQYFIATSTTASSTLPNLIATNLRLNGILYDTNNASGTNGYVLQTTGNGVQWVSTSSLNIAGGSGVTGGTDGMLTAWTGASTLTATGTPTAASYFATSTTATSTFLGGLSVVGSTGLNVLQNGNVGIGTASPSRTLYVNGDIESNNYIIAAYNFSNGYYYNSLSNAGYIFVDQTSPRINAPGGYVAFTNGATENMRVSATGNVGIGTSTPYAKLSVVGETVSSYFTATSTISTSTLAGGLNVGSGNLVYDFTTGITSINSLETGNLNFDTDAGAVSWVDLPISSALAGTVESYTAQIAGQGILTVFGIANGSGGVATTTVAIGTSTPYTNGLTVWGRDTIATTRSLDVVNNASTSLLTVFNGGIVKIGGSTSTTTINGYLDVLGTGSNSTSTFASNLWVKGSIQQSGSATSTFANGIQLSSGCFMLPSGSCLANGVASISGGQAGKMAFWTAADALSNNTDFAWDNTNLRLGIGTSTPNSILSISNSANTTVNTPLLTIASTTAGNSTSTLMTVLANGNVGIGTSSPFGKLAVDAGVTLVNTAINASGSINDFLQFDIKNTSTGSGAQAGYSATADNGTLTTNFAWMGINNSNFYNPQAYNVGGALDVSFMGSGNDMYVANAIANKKLHFMTGGTATTTNIRMTIDGNGKVGIGSTSPNYALDVNGDVNVATGKCFRVDGVCIGYVVKLVSVFASSSPGNNSSIVATGAVGSSPSFSGTTLTLPSNTSYYVAELWGGGGGGGASSTGATDATVGGNSCFGPNATACTGPYATAGGGGPGLDAAAGDRGAGGIATVVSTDQIGINGSPGHPGSATAEGGFGGNAPRGGAGGFATTTTTRKGFNGNSPGGGGAGGRGSATVNGGGGGGGAYVQVVSTSTATRYFTIGVGGTGANFGGVCTETTSGCGGNGANGGMVISVYATSSPNAAGTDYAEMFPVSNSLIGPGDIVSVDAGLPVSMKYAEQDDKALAGVVATKPGQILGDEKAIDQRPIALSGRVPVKVNLEGGVIRPGDRIAISSVRGVGKKAGPLEASVGIALDSFDSEEQGTVMMFVNIQQNISVKDIGEELLKAPSDADSYDFVANLLKVIETRYSGTTTPLTGFASSTASTTTDPSMLVNQPQDLSGLNTTASSTNSFDSLNKNYLNLIASTTSSVQTLADAIVALDLKVNALVASSTLNVDSIIASTSMALASSTDFVKLVATSTASVLSGDSSFIGTIANSVKSILASAQDWVVEKFTAKVAYINRVEVETVAISKGMEIVDQSTGATWCVTIKNGDWNKVQGVCASIATSTIALPTPNIPTPVPTLSPLPTIVPPPAESTTTISGGNSGSTTTPVGNGSNPTTPSVSPEPSPTPTTSTSPIQSAVPSPEITPTTPQPSPTSTNNSSSGSQSTTPVENPAPAPATEPAPVPTSSDTSANP